MKVLIGCPTHSRYRLCVDEYLRCVAALDYKDFKLVMADNSPDKELFRELVQKGVKVLGVDHYETARERILQSRNLLRDVCLDEGFDYFLSLEQDLLVAPDTLSRLLAHQKDIVSAYYGDRKELLLKEESTGKIQKATVDIPIVYLSVRQGRIRRANPEEVLGKGLVKVGGMGLGCCLISRRVLEKVKFRYNPEHKAFDDMYFCEDAENLGFELYVDGSIVVRHLHQGWAGVKK
jgi:hypothetical protein